MQVTTYGTYRYDWLQGFLDTTYNETEWHAGRIFSNALPAESYELALFGVIWI